MFNKLYIKKHFNLELLEIFTDPKELEVYISKIQLGGTVLLFMSSGNFGGLSLKKVLN
jgi:hypothetical protein